MKLPLIIVYISDMSQFNNKSDLLGFELFFLLHHIL